MQCLVLVVVALIACACAFSTMGARDSSSSLKMVFDLNKAVNTLSRNKVLTKTAELGLLTKLEKAGFTLTTAKPLLKLADEVDALGYLEASADNVLPLAATAIELAPGLIPLAGTAIKAGPAPLGLGAIASAAAAAAVVYTVPDDSVTDIAIQTAAVIPLGLVIPGAITIGAVFLSKLK